MYQLPMPSGDTAAGNGAPKLQVDFNNGLRRIKVGTKQLERRQRKNVGRHTCLGERKIMLC